MVSVCTTCKGLQKKYLSAEDTEAAAVEWVSTTLPGLRRSTSGGCRACATLLQGILLHHDRFAGVPEERVSICAKSLGSSEPKQRDRQDHLSVEIRWKTQDHGCSKDAGHDHEEEVGYPDLKLEFFTDKDGQSPFSAIGRGRHISENPLTDSGLATARAMIERCFSEHANCPRKQPTTLPKRVLDVLLQDGSNGVRLYESQYDAAEQRFEFGEYLTLSHCWGSGRSVLKTTKKNLSDHKKAIPWSSLPKTFQDAVVLTRSLGLRFLWLDSLCVVQDDRAEFIDQALQLDKIFSDSFLTVAATSAADSTEGLFLPKPQLFKIQATDKQGSLYKINVREQPSHYSFKANFDEGAHMNDWELPFNASAEANAHTPLLRRAWAYAERLLTPRVLHFTRAEIILECREGFQCECGRIDDSTFDSRTTDTVKQEFAILIAGSDDGAERPNGAIDTRVDSVAAQLAHTSLSDSDGSRSKIRDDAIQLWSYIVTEYTARNLTYDADRLVAITGVAKTFRSIFSSGYIAGQWTFSTLNLLWYPNSSGHCHRPQTGSNRLPTWSWAAVEGSPIFFDNTTAMDLACTVSFPPEKGRQHAWSPTAGKDVQLSAAMATEVAFHIDDTDEFSLVRNGVSVEFRPDIVPPRGDDDLKSGETLICVLVSMTFRSSIIGLVLKSSQSNPKEYRRVGRFECYECQRDDSEDEPEDAEQLFTYWFPEIEDMTQLDDRPKRTFTII